jgi:hypothetical protein
MINVTESQAYETIRAAQLHSAASGNGSAAVALEDSLALYNQGDFFYAHRRALRSLAYSVGIFSPVYAANFTSVIPGPVVLV